MTNRALSAAAAVLLAGVAGCGVTTPDLAEVGTVRFLAIEGGCWVIQADGGLSLEPINLPEHMRQDGLRVQFVAMERHDLGSVCMAGEIVELLRIEEAA